MSRHTRKIDSTAIFKAAVRDSFIKLDPRNMIKNPVMFVVEAGMAITLFLTFFPDSVEHGDWRYNAIVTAILFITLLFANFAEAMAEGRGKAQADSMKKTRRDTKAKRLSGGKTTVINSDELKKGDVVLAEAGDIIPNDGEVIEGLAMVDESAITGESAPVMKEAGGDFSSVTGGTKVVSDRLKIRITATPGQSFLDRMINLVEGAKRQKTPNETALTLLLVSLTMIFLIVVVTLYPLADFSHTPIKVSTLVALLVCLIPTTIGGLLSAIGIAGMDRVTKFNVIAMSGKAVEACGDVNTMILDKTGTITYGNRMAAEFIPVGGVSEVNAARFAVISSLFDDTPEGRSVIELGEKQGISLNKEDYSQAHPVEFSSASRMSGLDLKNGTRIRKGAFDAVSRFVTEAGGIVPDDLKEKSEKISGLGGTPLAVCAETHVMGLIYLKDTVKPGLSERFDKLRRLGIKTVMCTGDNPLTAATIAREAGVDDFIAECRPEDKIGVIRREQSQGKLVAMSGDGTNDAPALAQADVGLAMNSGTQSAKEAANMVDLDSDPTKIIEVVEIGKQLLITRGALTTFSISNDVAKYFAILPAVFTLAIPQMKLLNVMGLSSPNSAIISALVFNAIIIPLLIPIAMRGVSFKPMSADKLLLRNLAVFGLGGLAAPFLGIKLIDMLIGPALRALGLG
jgi:K+-transporting ATPase ATPase B chain